MSVTAFVLTSILAPLLAIVLACLAALVFGSIGIAVCQAAAWFKEPKP